MHRILKKNLILVAVVAMMLGLSSCTNREENTEQDQLDRIQQMIDQKMYQSAEAELQAMLSENPDNQRARVILSSVYVHRSGITVREYLSLRKLFEDDSAQVQGLINVEVLERLEIKKDSDLQKAVTFLKQLNQVTIASQMMATKFQKIPLIDEEQASDIYLALVELEKIDKPTRGHSFYRGVIKLIYFKFLWENDKFLKINDKKLCSTSMNRLNQQLEVLKKYSVGMVVDVSAGMPKNEEQFKKTAQDLDKSLGQAQKFIRSLGEAQLTISQIVNQIVTTADIKGFKCDF